MKERPEYESKRIGKRSRRVSKLVPRSRQRWRRRREYAHSSVVVRRSPSTRETLVLLPKLDKVPRKFRIRVSSDDGVGRFTFRREDVVLAIGGVVQLLTSLDVLEGIRSRFEEDCRCLRFGFCFFVLCTSEGERLRNEFQTASLSASLSYARSTSKNAPEGN